MEKLKYVVEDRTIAELLGIQNFTNKEAAILELVKNAYDAQAKNIYISIDKEKIVIEDDGIGMDENTIRQNWMHVGKSEKGYMVVDEVNGEKRILAGSKGVGRFALARLGAYVTLYGKREDFEPVKWYTDWSESILNDWNDEDKISLGTKIVIAGLRDRWTDKSIKNLIDYLSSTYNDERMHIHISPKLDKVVSYVFKSFKLGENYVSKISLDYDAMTQILTTNIQNDEFLDKISSKCSPIDINKYVKKIDVYDEVSGDDDLEISEEYLKNALKELGSFSAEFYFALKSIPKDDKEEFGYKYSHINNRNDYGIILYRNAFSIASFDGKKDWLGLNQRTRKSPAAATHPTGSWRVRSNQLSGHVNIDKEENILLKDVANRQGMEEDEYYKLFVKIILIGISVFERYRQSIVRTLVKKREVKKISLTPIIEKIAEQIIIKFDDINFKELRNEIKYIKKESNDIKIEKENAEKRYRYDVRILNVLATTGLKASSIAHELKNDRNSVNVNYQYIVDALKKYNMWEELTSEDCTKYAYADVPRLLERNKVINAKIAAFMNTMLDEIEKKRFSPRELSIYQIMDKITKNWMRDYASLNINLNIDENLCYEISEDVFSTIFDNLILNTWQQNQSSSKININISIKNINQMLKITYSDDGKGLPKKYIKDPMRILEVHESSRENGHGLGMWILNNTVQMTGGEVNYINGENGFEISLEVGGKL